MKRAGRRPSTASLFRFLLTCLAVALTSPAAHGAGYPGLPTRDQNPLLQGYLIPTAPVTAEAGWSTSHDLCITNTYQTDAADDELLVIDVENIRYNLSLTYTEHAWSFGVMGSLIDNSAGSLDNLIEDWHDFFGLPQGGRDQAPADRLLMTYQKDGTTLIDIDRESSAVGDVQLFASYRISQNQQLHLLLKLPSPDPVEPISNDAFELGVGYTWYAGLGPDLTHFGMLALSSIADEGILQQQLNASLVSAQYGIDYRLHADYRLLLQADYHSPLVDDSALDAFDHSLQMQFALRLPRVSKNQQLDIYFSEDILPGHAPDITFSLRLSTSIY